MDCFDVFIMVSVYCLVGHLDHDFILSQLYPSCLTF